MARSCPPESIPLKKLHKDPLTRKKWTKERWFEVVGSKLAEAERVRKASLPESCRLAPDDDPNWTQWREVEGVFGKHWEREKLEPMEPLVDLIVG